MSGEGIQFGGMPASSVCKGVIESGQIEGPLSLVIIQGLGCSEICEVSMVVQDLNCVFSPFQDVSPLLKPMYDQ